MISTIPNFVWKSRNHIDAREPLPDEQECSEGSGSFLLDIIRERDYFIYIANLGIEIQCINGQFDRLTK